ncbi:MAG TPA: hypothetical protein PKA63_12760 [Oligoflexia bacterium]|nr:hypothetical protein [Oligoflexia bacterium]HMP49529.1 hypothetical protein [Oligoflexia bacterium]
MKRKTISLSLGSILFLSACATEYRPLEIPNTHPASIAAEESSVYESSTTLDRQEITSKENEDNREKRKNMKSMNHMEGMNHHAH